MAIPAAQVDAAAVQALDEADEAARREAKAKLDAEARARTEAEAQPPDDETGAAASNPSRNPMTRPSMPNAKVLAGATRLKQTTRALRDQWLSTEAGWGDVVRQRFEERYLAPHRARCRFRNQRPAGDRRGARPGPSRLFRPE